MFNDLENILHINIIDQYMRKKCNIMGCSLNKVSFGWLFKEFLLFHKSSQKYYFNSLEIWNQSIFANIKEILNKENKELSKSNS